MPRTSSRYSQPGLAPYIIGHESLNSALRDDDFDDTVHTVHIALIAHAAHAEFDQRPIMSSVSAGAAPPP